MTELVFTDSQRFPHETIDGETIIIDAESGRLFLLTGVGPWLWSKLAAGASFEALVDELTAKYSADSASPTLAFLSSLKELGLLRSTPGAAAPVMDAPALPDLFVAPALEKYDGTPIPGAEKEVTFQGKNGNLMKSPWPESRRSELFPVSQLRSTSAGSGKGGRQRSGRQDISFAPQTFSALATSGPGTPYSEAVGLAPACAHLWNA